MYRCSLLLHNINYYEFLWNLMLSIWLSPQWQFLYVVLRRRIVSLYSVILLCVAEIIVSSHFVALCALWILSIFFFLLYLFFFKLIPINIYEILCQKLPIWKSIFKKKLNVKYIYIYIEKERKSNNTLRKHIIIINTNFDI